MSETPSACPTMEVEVVALARGELSPAEAAPVRAHLAACTSCAALAADVAAVRAAAAARPAPVQDGASRTRLLAALDAAWDQVEAEEAARARSRGPVLRLLDQAGRRYAESRRFRFLTLSLAAHAAAAVALTVYLVGGGGTERGSDPLTISTGVVLPPPYPEEDPIAPPTVRVPVEGYPPLSGIDLALPDPGSPLFGREPSPVYLDPLEGAGSRSLYPTAEFTASASGRFRSADMRARRLAAAWGEERVTGVRRSVEVALRYLEQTQEPDGTWASGSPGDPAPQRDRFRGGTTGVVLSAYLADGRTALRQGSFSSTVGKAVAALARSPDPRTGLLGTFASGAANDRPLCNHGPALGALAEYYGLDWRFLTEATRTGLESIIEKGVAATLKAQLADGSFGYAPGARSGDASVTLLQVEALEAARVAGFEVGDALDRAAAWLCQRIGADGRLGYHAAGDRGSDATLTAGALALGRVLDLPAEVRERMLAEVLGEAASTDLSGRVLFRSSLLEVLAARSAAGPAAPAGAAVDGALRSQTRSGSFPARTDTWARAAGDALSTARTVRALTAPYRSTAP